MTQEKTRSIDERRARTRTLIQLGGLLHKSGLTSLVDIEPGQDLQKDDECFDGVATLFGALLDLKNMWAQEDIEQQKILWMERGKRELWESI